MDWREKLGLASREDLENLEERVEKLEESLRDELISDKPQLSYILELLRDGAEARPVLVEQLEDEFDVSQATAYRRLETLEEEMGFIRENEEGELELLVDLSQGVRSGATDKQVLDS